MASQHSRELMLMLNSVLDVYKLEDGRLALNRRPANLAELSAHSAEQVRPIATQNSVHLTFDIPPDLPPLDVDEEMIVRVLSNLLLSAIKATPAGGQVRVTATTQPGPLAVVRVSISDTGESIAPTRERALPRRSWSGYSTVSTSQPGAGTSGAQAWD